MNLIRLSLGVASFSLLGTACSSSPTAPPSDEALIIEPSSVTLFASQDSANFKALKRDSRGHKSECSDATWRSEDTGVVVVNGAGKIKARAVGIAMVVASCGTLQAAATVQVTERRDPASIKAFPEAAGWGAGALASCRSGGTEVLAVTNLDNEGPGSLRAAVETSRDDRLSIIVFRVGGYLKLGREIELRDRACIYFAGQTAPGDGVTIRRSPGRSFYIKGTSHDIVFRHLRFRGGHAGDYGDHIGIQVGSGSNFILDHLSFSWMTGKFIIIKKSATGWSHPVSRITVQRSILAEILADGPTGMQVSGEDNDGATDWKLIQDISIHSNLFAHNSHRNPNVTTVGTEVINNVIYNWRMGAVQSTRGSRLDVISNVFMPGPMTASAHQFEATWSCDNHEGFEPSLYVAGNLGPHNSDPSADNWAAGSRMTACYYNTGSVPGAELPSSFRRNSPLSQPAWPVTVRSASSVTDDVLGDVGASAGLECSGGWRGRPDAADARILEEVRTGTGVSSPPESEFDVGGFPTLDSGQACPDRDRDGMPDAFEERMGFDADNPGDAMLDNDRDGYTNIEEYVNASI